MDTFFIKKGDRREAIRRTLKGSNSLAVNLTGATVKFFMSKDGTIKVNAAAVLVDAANGVVEYQWIATDTDTPGIYRSEFEATFGDGTKQTFPNADYIAVHVLEDLA